MNEKTDKETENEIAVQRRRENKCSACDGTGTTPPLEQIPAPDTTCQSPAAGNNSGGGEGNKKDGSSFFLNTFKKKNVKIKNVSGETVTGKLKKFNRYELLLDVEGQEVVVFKHALFSVQKTEQQQPDDIRAVEVV